MSIAESTMSEQDVKAKQDPRAIIPEFFRAATRPAVTVIFAAVIAQVVVERIDAPDWFIALATACILWWFGDRTVQHVKEKK